jgi:hypothetical protein
VDLLVVRYGKPWWLVECKSGQTDPAPALARPSVRRPNPAPRDCAWAPPAATLGHAWWTGAIVPAASLTTAVVTASPSWTAGPVPQVPLTIWERADRSWRIATSATSRARCYPRPATKGSFRQWWGAVGTAPAFPSASVRVPWRNSVQTQATTCVTGANSTVTPWGRRGAPTA